MARYISVGQINYLLSSIMGGYMKNKSRSLYIVLGLVGAFWFTGCCTYPGGMVAVYSNNPRPHHPKPAPVIHHYAPAPHHPQAFLPQSYRHGGGPRGPRR